MAHLLRAIPDSILKRGYVTVGNDLKTIDQNTFVSVNGDAGGTWTPAADLNINGAGVVVAGPWAVSGAQMTVSAPTFGKGTADDAFGLSAAHAGRTQTLCQALIECYANFPEQVAASPGYTAGVAALVTTTPGVRFFTPLRTYGGATLETVTLTYYVGAVHAALPQVFPQMRIIAIDAQGTLFPLGAGTLYDVGGFHAISAATAPGLLYQPETVYEFVYTCTQNNVIDGSRFTYWLEIIEESGANCFSGGVGSPGNYFVSAVSALDRIALFDGRN